MPAFLGEWVVGLVLALVVFLAIRSLWKGHKSGGHCGGSCSGCAGCSGSGCCSVHRGKTQ